MESHYYNKIWEVENKYELSIPIHVYSYTKMFFFKYCLQCHCHWVPEGIGGGANLVKMASYQYENYSHSVDKAILQPSYLHSGISNAVKARSLYWEGPCIIIAQRWDQIISHFISKHNSYLYHSVVKLIFKQLYWRRVFYYCFSGGANAS